MAAGTAPGEVPHAMPSRLITPLGDAALKAVLALTRARGMADGAAATEPMGVWMASGIPAVPIAGRDPGSTDDNWTTTEGEEATFLTRSTTSPAPLLTAEHHEPPRITTARDL